MPQRVRSRRGLATWLAETTTPLFVLDARRKVLFFNHGCEVLTGWDAGDVIGQVCDYVSEPDSSQVESLTGSLCPPPEVFEGREQSVPTFIQSREGARLTRMTSFVPLTGDEGSVDRVIGMILRLPEPARRSFITPDRQLHADLAAIRADLRKRYDVTSLVGQSAAFRRVLRQIDVALKSTVSIHFQGEPGTGREHIARLIHYQGHAGLQSFVPLDCARLTSDEIRETLKRVLAAAIESELPHLRPATLLLRNVDRLPVDVQRDIVETWGRSDAPPAIRLMSDTIRSFEEAMHSDRISEEFFHFMTSLVIRVPPLRERMEDLPLLAQDMLERHNRDREQQVTGFTEEVWSAFRRYQWPGNQDELQAVVREARASCTGKLIMAQDLPFRFRAGQEGQRVSHAPAAEIPHLKDRLEDVEREHIQMALELSGQNKSQAAERLGITRPKLYRRMQLLGLTDAVVDAD